MALEESELEMARRHVAEGERHVRLQCEITDHLRALGAPTQVAEQLRRQFEELLTQHRKHLADIERRGTVSPADLPMNVRFQDVSGTR